MNTPVMPPATGATTAGRMPWLTLTVSVILTGALVFVYLNGGVMTHAVLLATGAAAIAAYAAAVHPRSIFVSFAVVLGAVPYMHVPATSVPLLLVLAVGVWVALVFLPGVDVRPGWPEFWVFMLAATSIVSVVATGASRTALVEYAAWLAATAVVIPLRFLPAAARILTVRALAISTAVGAALGIFIRAQRHEPLIGLLSAAGYDPDGNVQHVYGSETISTRLSGTFLEPNIAGLILATGLVLTVAYFHGPARMALVVVIGAGLLLTLSRAAIASVLLAGLVVVLRAPIHRFAVVVAGFVAGLAALALPPVRIRLMDTFGPSDIGTLARQLALEDFPRLMDGHWVWGLGWARAEFRSRSLGEAVNYVANAPLVTIYRGGIVVGTVAIAVLIVLVVRSWFAAGRSFEDAVVCAGVIGFVLVALQLDFPVALSAPATTMFSFLVAMSLVHAPEPPPPRPARQTSA
jgi:hypothetical protein